MGKSEIGIAASSATSVDAPARSSPGPWRISSGSAWSQAFAGDIALQHYLRRWMTVLGRHAEPMLGGIMICQYAVNAAIDDAVCKHGGRMAARRRLFEQCQGTRRIAGPAGAGQHHLAERDLSVHHADLGRARDPSAPFCEIAVHASSLDQDAAIPELRVRHSVGGFAQPQRRLPVVARHANTMRQTDGTIVRSYRITRCRRQLEPFV